MSEYCPYFRAFCVACGRMSPTFFLPRPMRRFQDAVECRCRCGAIHKIDVGRHCIEHRMCRFRAGLLIHDHIRWSRLKWSLYGA